VMSRLVRPLGGFECDPNKPILSEKFGEVQDANFGDLGHTFHNMTMQAAARAGFSMIEPGSVFWYHGSPVCSNLSNANTGSKGETAVDVSNVEAFGAGIPAIAPSVVTLEQVPAFKDSQGAANLYQVLDDNGYLYQWRILNMADYGVPNERLRYWLLGWQAHLNPWYFPVPTRRTGWYEATYDLPFADLPPEKLLRCQEVAIEVHQYHYRSDTFLIERVATREKPKIKTPYEPAPTIRRMIFTDQKPGDCDKLVSRHFCMDAMIKGQMKTLGLPHIRRLASFPDWFQHPNIPAIAGVGFGYACSPEFVRLLVEANLG
jgi:DNA (cytosine-5)-methyltransferase 1